MTGSRVWLFRILILLGIAGIIISWFLPWWSLDIESFFKPEAIIIHPYGLEDTTNLAGALNVGLPGFFAPLIWIYFGLVITALVIAAIFMKKDITLFGKKLNLSRWIIGIAGFSYLVVPIVAVIVAAIMTGDIDGLPLIKRYYITMGGGMLSWVQGHLRFGYWLALSIGPFLMAIALFRNKIIGKIDNN